MDLCKRRYSNRYDQTTSEGWFRNIVLKAPLIFLPARLSDAFIISSVNVIPWLPGELEANCVMLCAEEGAMWQALRLLRFSIEWARNRRCVEYRLSSETGYDIAALAMRVGASELSPRYCVRLT